MRLISRNVDRLAKIISTSIFLLTVICIPTASAAPSFGSPTSVNQNGFSTYTFTGISATPDGTKVIASTGNGYLIFSSDSGTTWSNITSAGVHNWSTVAINDSGTVMAAGDSGGYIYLSTNSGSTWSPQNSTYPGTGTWYSLDMNSTGSVIAGTSNGTTAVITSNSGATWALRTISGSSYNRTIYVSSSGSKIAFMSYGSSNVYTSTDTGTTFSLQTIPGSGLSYPCLWASRDGQKITFAKTSTTFARSLDFGTTWDTFTVPSSVCTGFSASEDMSAMWIGQNGGPSAYSINSGSNWSYTTTTGSSWSTINLNSTGTHWIAGLPSYGVFTADGSPSGLTKRPIYLGAANWSRSSISTDGSVIAVSTGNGEVSISRDSGNTWNSTAGNLGINSSWTCLAVSGDGNTIYAGGSSVRLWKSSDRGVSWNQTGSDTYTASAFTSNGCATNSDGSRIALISNLQGVLISTNSGSTFSLSLSNSFNSTTYTYQSVTMTSDGTKWAVDETLLNSPIIVNTNGGASGSWVVTTGVPTRPGADLKSAGDGSVLIASFANSSAPLISRDWGSTWGSIAGIGSTFGYATSISSNGGLLIMGQSTAASGILYYSIDKGATFNQVPGVFTGGFTIAALSGNASTLIYGANNRQLQVMSISMTTKANFATFAPSGSASYRAPLTLTATLATAGTDGAVAFLANGKAIPGCVKVNTISLVANCYWRPSFRGGVNLTAISYPSDSNFTSGVATISLSVGNRTGKR